MDEALQALLKLVHLLIDAINGRIGRRSTWLVLIAVRLWASNAVLRKALEISSNTILDMLDCMFAAIFRLGRADTLLTHAHGRIDILYNRF